MPITPTKYIWFNGEMVPWEKATVHVLTHAMHYGSSVFEGIRCYDTPSGPTIFRGAAHIRRMRDSCWIYRMELPITQGQFLEVLKEVIRANELRSAYIRPLVWRGFGEIAPSPIRNPVEAMVCAFPFGAFLGPESIENGVDAGVVSWMRMAPNTIPAMAKAGGNYLSSQLISMEAERHGYAEGIALDVNGLVSEGGGENIFAIRDGILFTPPVTAALLPGITRDSVMTLAKHLGYEVREQAMPREALYVADELFFTGTATEIAPIRSVDRSVIGSGKRGPITAEIQRAFFGLFTGETEDQWGWLEPV